MTQPSEIPRFRGDESPEEAETWLEKLVESTGSFSDNGIFRLLGMRFPAGSPAQEWFNSLDVGAKTSWDMFKQAFHSRWIETAERIQKQRAWNAFAHHALSDDTIFNGKDFDYEYSSKILRQWAEEHLKLGNATDSDDEILVATTQGLLPSFIQAYFRAYFQGRQFSNINDLCSEIISFPSQILLFECTRRQIAPMEKIVSMEKQINLMSEKMDKIMNMMNQGRFTGGNASYSDPLNEASGRTNHSEDTATSSNDSINWEQCSPLTSVVSICDPGSAPASDVSTPIAPALQLSNPIEGDQPSLLSFEAINDSGTTLEPANTVNYYVPKEWRKPVVTKSKKELIQIARQAIEFAARHRNASYTKMDELNIFNSAVAIFDRLTGSTLRVNGVFWQGCSSTTTLCYLLDAIQFVHSYYTHKWYDHLSRSINYWSTMTTSGSLAKLDQARIHFYTDGSPVISIGGISHYISTDFFSPSDSSWAFCYNYSRGGYAISAIHTILFMTLSSYLAECSGESKYTEAAVSTANCVKTWMLDPETYLIKERMLYISDAKEASGAVLSCHLTGLTIEGLTVLASVTGNNEWNKMAINIAKAAIHYEAWHNSDGILIASTDGNASEFTETKAMKGLLNRGLLVAYQRNRSNEAFCDLIRSYVNVQFNSLYDSSRMLDTYGADWRGPYAGPYIHSQIAAIDTIVAAIAVNDEKVSGSFTC